MNKTALLIGLCIIFLCSICTASADVGDWVIDGNKVYVDDSKVYLSAEPHTISESGFVYFDINSKTYSGDVDLYYGFNSGGLEPTRVYYNNNGEWVNIASHFNKANYDYDGFGTWYYSNGLPVQAGKTYRIAVWMEQANEVSCGKYGFGIKPSFQTLDQAIAAGNFYYLDPWWNSNWNNHSTVTLNASAPENDFTIHMSSDDFAIPLTMWNIMNQDGNDTRILHSDNSTVFSHWIEHLTARDNYSIWVNVTDNTTGTTLMWYYDNPSADSSSNISTVAIFGDDFPGSSIDTNKWDGDTGYTTVSAGILSFHPTSAKTIKSITQSDNTDIVIHSKIKCSTGNSYIHYWGLSDPADTHHAFRYTDYTSTNRISTKDGTTTNDVNSNWPLDSWYIGDINIIGGVSVSAYANGVERTGSPVTSNVPDSSELEVFISARDTSNVEAIDCDWIFVRKYVPDEPIVIGISDPESFVNTAPTTPTIISPANTSVITSVGIVELNVSSTDIDAGDTITYYFYGDTVDGSTFLGTSTTVYNWSPQNGIYYWKAIAYDGTDYSNFSNISHFKLIAPPNLTSPFNASTQYETYPPLTATVSFTWQDLAAPQYRLMIAEDAGFNIMAVDIHVGTNNSDQDLIVNEEYFWKIYSYDGASYSDSSDVYSFNLTGNSTLTGSAIEGVVYQSNGDISAIPGAEVSIWNTTWSSSMVTGSNGYYVFEDLNSGTVYNLQAKADRYLDSSISLVNATSNPVTNNFYLIDDLTDTEWWHYVEFTLQNVWGVTHPGVVTNVYMGTSPTVIESGTTGSDGTITFHLNQNVEYRITFINSTHGINEETVLYPISKSYTIYIDEYSFALPNVVTDDIQAYIASSRIDATHGYINFTWSDTSGLTSSINYYIHDVDGNELYNTSNSGPDMFDSQIVTATDDRYIVGYVGMHPTHETITHSETVVFHGGRRVDFGWSHDWQYAVTALAFLIFVGSMFGAKTAHYGAITVVVFGFIFKWIGWLNETNTSTLLVILAAVIAFGWSLRKSEEVKQ